MPGFELLWRMQVAAHPQPLAPVRHEMALGQECKSGSVRQEGRSAVAHLAHRQLYCCVAPWVCCPAVP
ncbi:hypothetical protein GE21DRAFT_1277898 [Neurospora crassa]|nr:hypothetical protein GE21DRAFT_1277898 [Neurospora crassa]